MTRSRDLFRDLYTLIKHLYFESAAYSTGIGTNDVLFIVAAGVCTGCPMSATLFLLAINPFAELLVCLGSNIIQYVITCHIIHNVNIYICVYVHDYALSYFFEACTYMFDAL